MGNGNNERRSVATKSWNVFKEIRDRNRVISQKTSSLSEVGQCWSLTKYMVNHG